MSVLRSVVIEVLVLGVVGLALGMTANVVRSSGSLDWTKNYFAMAPAPVVKVQSEAAVEGADSPPEETVASGHSDHPYQSISFEEMAEICSDPDNNCGQYVFVDARSKEAYDEGHIKGAVRCDPYQVHENLDCVLDQAQAAEKVIVYCNGDNCEDSVFMCRELRAADVPCEAIFIYPGGWTEWEENDMPVCKADETQ